MGNRKRNQRRAARERMLAERARQERLERRRRQLSVLGSVVAVLAIIVAAGVLIQQQRAEGDGDKSSTAPAAALSGPSIAVGEESAPVTLTLYEDFRCPACKNFEDKFGETISDLVDENTLKIDYHIASFLDGHLGGQGSKLAGNAALCADDQGQFWDYHTVLYDNQPPESEDGFTTDRLLELAGQVDGLRTPEFEQCVRDNTNASRVTAMQEHFDEAFGGKGGTPTVILGDENLTDLDRVDRPEAMESPEKFRAAVEELAARRGPTSPSEGATPGTDTG